MSPGTMWDAGRSQFLPFTITVLGIVFTDLLTGIGMGLAVATIVILHRSNPVRRVDAVPEEEASVTVELEPATLRAIRLLGLVEVMCCFEDDGPYISFIGNADVLGREDLYGPQRIVLRVT